MAHLLRLSCSAFVLLVGMQGCGGGGSGSTPLPGIQSIEVQKDGAYHMFFADATSVHYIEIGSATVAESNISLKVDFSGTGTNRQCQLGDMTLTEMPTGKFSLEFQPAYFDETLELRCTDDLTSVTKTVHLTASDPELSAYFDFYFDEYIPKASDLQPDDPYSGYRRHSYYSAIYTFLAAAEMYLNPELFGLDIAGERYQQIELFLINGAEAYFEPCVDYDVFSSFPSKQCRSLERVGEFYLWRSAEDRDNIRTNHPKTEWRGTGGISQAIKAILLRNPGLEGDICPISDEPSLIRHSSLYCRAINVRRLIYEEVWRKWKANIENTRVAHYIAWTELIVDLFESTSEIAPNLNCANCTPDEGMEQVTSNLDGLLEYFSSNEDGTVNMKCHTPDDTTPYCVWTTYDFSLSGSIEIGHQDTTVHLLSKDGLAEVCAGEDGPCIDVNALVKTFSEQTWEDLENIGNASGFPKFDMFLNGYCSENYANDESELQEFCWKFWYSETGRWPAHRKLFGWVNLGRYDRNLMIKLRRAADENHDGLLNKGDLYLKTYAAFLVRAENGTD